ncbi:alpha/beta hydrolase [Paraburkholderia sp.]|jgi:pimeloyl-ACP methyl ester carboxylesterase|uniref:alpha/beta fold hydrolase n=1 Tax=Paraburkholderia sp. TaxID=1926495 RepID=UPI002F3F541E
MVEREDGARVTQQQFAVRRERDRARLLAATQEPWFSGCLAENIGHAAWHDKPSWYVLTTEDHIVGPAFQMKMAKRIGATVVNVDASHVPMLSKPEEVAAAIISAARQTK